MHNINKEKRKKLATLIDDINHISTLRPYEIFYPFYVNQEYDRWIKKVIKVIVIRQQFKSFLEALKVFLEHCYSELKVKPLIPSSVNLELVEMIHPIILKMSYEQFQQGHYKDSILNGINTLFQHIRDKTNSEEDGKNLIGKVFSIKNPKLILNELDTSSGENEQQGFIQLFNGLYQGVRNPNSHGLKNSFTKLETMQYLIFISLLVTKVDNAKVVNESE